MNTRKSFFFCQYQDPSERHFLDTFSFLLYIFYIVLCYIVKEVYLFKKTQNLSVVTKITVKILMIFYLQLKYRINYINIYITIYLKLFDYTYR